MINGKFFSGLTEGMMRKSNPGVDRQRTNFFWPEEEQPDTTDSSPRKNSNNNEDLCKSRYKQQLTSNINFYDDTVDTPGDSKKVTNNRNNSDKNNTKNDFYGYEGNYNSNNVQESGRGNNNDNSKTNGKTDENISRRDKVGMNGESMQNNKNENNKYAITSKSIENIASSKNDINSINGKLNDMKITKNNNNYYNNNNNNNNYEQTKTTTRSSHTSSNVISKQQQQQPRKNISNGNKPKYNDNNNNNNESEFYKPRENNQQSRRIPVVVEDTNNTNNTNFMSTTNDTNRIIKSGRRSNYEEQDPKEAYRKNRNERQATQMGSTMYGYQTADEIRVDADDVRKSTTTRKYEKDTNSAQPVINRGLTRSLTIHGPADTIPNEARQRAMSHLKSSIFFNDDTATATPDRRPASVKPMRGNNGF